MQYANYVQPTVEIGGETYDVKLEIVDNRTWPLPKYRELLFIS